MNTKAGIPNYASGIKITATNYRVPNYGVICGSLTTPENSKKYYFYINGVKVAYSMGKASRSNGDSNISVIVKSNDVFTFDSGAILDNVYFFPFS